MSFAGFMAGMPARALRAVIGLVLVFAGYMTRGWGWVLIAVGALFFLSGALNFCGISKALGQPFWGKHVDHSPAPAH